MRYLIIGLGIYGSNLAKDLTTAGHEVIGVDRNPVLVDAVKDLIATVYTLDSTDESALSVLPLSGVDEVIVAIGENFGASVKTVALLKKLGVQHIYARASDEIHEAILEGLKVERIVTPEQRAAFDLTQEMLLGQQTQVLKITADTYVMKFNAPDYFEGMKYSDLSILTDYGLSLVTATRPVPVRNLLGLASMRPEELDFKADDTLRVIRGDIFTCYGSVASYHKLIKHIK